jgi:hypothetical protein
MPLPSNYFDLFSCQGNNLIREIIGNPFRAIAFDPTWLSQGVVNLAERTYESQDFTWMPQLADSLEDVGCTNADILNHCRQPGEHVRGCWAVDLILGKELRHD